MKVSELEGHLLDYWVGRAEGYMPVWSEDHWYIGMNQSLEYSPSTSWKRAGPIIERERIEIRPIVDGIGKRGWIAQIGAFDYPAETPLIAAMRVYVASKFGSEVSEVTE